MAVFLPSVPILSYFTKKSRNSVGGIAALCCADWWLSATLCLKSGIISPLL